MKITTKNEISLFTGPSPHAVCFARRRLIYITFVAVVGVRADGIEAGQSPTTLLTVLIISF